MKNTADPVPTTNRLDEAGDSTVDGFGELRVNGTELSTNGLDQLAVLLLKLGHPNEQPIEHELGQD